MSLLRLPALSILAFTCAFALLLCSSVPAAYCKTAPLSPTQQIATSLTAWNKLNKQAKGNYTYTVSRSSFSGARWTTTIIVRSNNIVERRYEVTTGRGGIALPGQKPAKKEPKWIEKGRDVGAHKEGASPKTIDQLYAEAKTIAEKKLERHMKRYISFHKNGVLKSCFYIDTRIADDAPTTGVRISTIRIDRVK